MHRARGLLSGKDVGKLKYAVGFTSAPLNILELVVGGVCLVTWSMLCLWVSVLLRPLVCYRHAALVWTFPSSGRMC